MNIKDRLPMSSLDFDWAISLFYLSYVSRSRECSSKYSRVHLFLFQLIFEIPSTLLLRIIGPTQYLSLSVILWGSVTIGMAFVKDAQQILITRVLLVSSLNCVR